MTTRRRGEIIDWKRYRGRIIKMYEAGMSLRAIAARLKKYLGGRGPSHVTVNKWLSRWGVHRRSGAARQRTPVHELSGRRFGRLTALGRDPGRYPAHWVCRCDCGIKKSVRGDKLVHGMILSCGCGKKR